MEVSAEVQAGVALLGDGAAFNQQLFQQLVDFTLQDILRQDTKQQQQQLPTTNDPIIAKHAHAALTILILEAAKINADPQILREALDDAKVPADRVEYIAKQYNNNRTALRNMLATHTFGFPQIIGVDWRLDYHIKSNSLEKINEPVFMVQLNTKRNLRIGEDEKSGRRMTWSISSDCVIS